MTEDKTTITDNEVIVYCIELAKFMEFPYTKIVPQYHRDWSALMPVWYKFKDLEFDAVSVDVEHVQHCREISNAILYHGPSPSEACKLLAEGIRWYNSVKK